MVLLLLSFLEVSSLGNGAHGQSAQRKLRFTPLMRVETAKIVVAANGKGTYEITDQLASAVTSAVQTRAVTVFVRHTSCGLIMMENADPPARRDRVRRVADKPFGSIIQRPSPGWDRTRSA
jgi:Uncharacterised protein family UPF0047